MRDARTWIEIDARALRRNAESFLRLIPPDARLMAVIKSNAYGHGLVHAAHALEHLPRISFGVDSITEALRLPRGRITKTPPLL